MHRLLLAPGLVAALVATPSPAQAAGPAALACCVKLPLITWVTAIGSRRGGAGTPQASAKRLEAPRRWGVGTWLGGLGLQGPHEGSAAGPLAFGGVGLQARYRVRRAWGLELSAGALHASTPGGVTGRDMFPVSGSLMAYLKPEGFLQIYGLAGLGLAPTGW